MPIDKWVIDSEYIPLQNEKYVEDLKCKVYPKKAYLFGILNMSTMEYTYLQNTTIHDVINYIFEHSSNKVIHVYAYFNTAELSCHEANFFSKFRKMNIEVKKVIPKGKISFVTLQKDDKMLHILDVMALLGSQQSLEKTCKAFNVPNPKDYLRELGYDHDSDIVNNLTFEQLVEYNKRDCVATAEVIKKFRKYLTELAKTHFNININVDDIWTLGGAITKIIKQLEKKHNENIINHFSNFLRRYRKGNYYGTDLDRLTKRYIQLGLEAYRGGGIILYYGKPNQFYDKVNIYDVVSLYPLSAYLMAQKLPRNIEKIQPLGIWEVEKRLQDPKYEGFVQARLKLKEDRERCYIAYRDVDVTDIDPEKVQRSYFLKEVPMQYYSFFELRIIKALGDYEVQYGKEDTDIQVGFYWEGSPYNTLLDYFDTLLNLKNTINESEDPVMYWITKILLNASYGKLVEHEKELEDSDYEKYTPPLYAPLLGALITSYSRGIMYLLNHLYKPFHLATDSMFCEEKIDVNEAYDLLMLALDSQNLKYPDSYKTLLKEELIDGSGLVLRGKCYYIKSKDNTKVKEAHHAVHIDKSEVDKFWQVMLNNPYTVLKYKRKTWLTFSSINDKVQNKKNFKAKPYLYDYVFLECEKEYYYLPAKNNYLTWDFKHFEDLKQAKTSLRKTMNKQTKNRELIKKIFAGQAGLKDQLHIDWLSERKGLEFKELN